MNMYRSAYTQRTGICMLCSEANAERALDGRSLPPNVDIQTRPKTHEHTPNDSQRPTYIPLVTVTVTVGMIIAVTIVHTSVPSAAALPPQRIALMRRANAYPEPWLRGVELSVKDFESAYSMRIACV